MLIKKIKKTKVGEVSLVKPVLDRTEAQEAMLAFYAQHSHKKEDHELQKLLDEGLYAVKKSMLYPLAQAIISFAKELDSKSKGAFLNRSPFLIADTFKTATFFYYRLDGHLLNDESYDALGEYILTNKAHFKAKGVIPSQLDPAKLDKPEYHTIVPLSNYDVDICQIITCLQNGWQMSHNNTEEQLEFYRKLQDLRESITQTNTKQPPSTLGKKLLLRKNKGISN
jgi:hypothetical protein